MIQFVPYADNAAAPAIFVNGVGGIHKIGKNSLQVVFVTRLRDADGEWQTSAVVSLIWDEQAWIEAGKLFRFAMEQWRLGRPETDNGNGKRGDQAGMH